MDIILAHWGQGVTPSDWLCGDPSGDGFVGADDLDMLLAHWGQGTLATATIHTPEPARLMTVLAGGLLFLRRKLR